MGRWLVTALVRGPSMVPTLRDGDAVLARRGGRAPRPGDVVLARFPSRPDLLVIKRIVRGESPGLYWIQGDNELVADDSRRYGPAAIEARVVFTWWPRLKRL